MINIEEFISDSFVLESNSTNLEIQKSQIEYIADYINTNFDEINNEVKEKALIKLCNTDIGSDNTSSVIIENYDSLSDKVKNEFLKLSQNPKGSKEVVSILQYKFYNLPFDYRNSLLENLNINNESIKVLSHIINEAFKNIPLKIKENLILKMLDYENTDFYILRLLKFNFDNIESSLREKLLLKISDNNKLNKPISFIVREKINDISSENLGKLLLTLLSGYYSKYTLYIARDYFELLNIEYQKLIINKLIDNYYEKNISKKRNFNVSGELQTVLYLIIREYNKNPDKKYYNEILQKLSKNHSTVWGIVGCLIKNFDDLDSDIANTLLLNISEYPEVKESVSHIIKYKSDKIPEEVVDILDKKLSIS